MGRFYNSIGNLVPNSKIRKQRGGYPVCHREAIPRVRQVSLMVTNSNLGNNWDRTTIPDGRWVWCSTRSHALVRRPFLGPEWISTRQ
mmetsp:Transcript_10316/g.10397  ORF Transcript_10316/g.10397 Transcript_10316/m.10397 type:complete len:87 (-) Transcript_10316:183-443(-)